MADAKAMERRATALRRRFGLGLASRIELLELLRLLELERDGVEEDRVCRRGASGRSVGSLAMMAASSSQSGVRYRG